MEALLLAGGKGTRLLPFTKILPKPLLPLGNSPIAEFMINRLIEIGCTKIYFSIGYLGHYIKLYFGNGSKWGIPFEYIEDLEPLGTIGALSKVPLIGPTLVINGDILCLENLQDFYQAHVQESADLTLLSHKKNITLDFGALMIEDSKVLGITEKPLYPFLISAGIYIVNPIVTSYLPVGYCDMPSLIQTLLANGKNVRHYEGTKLWMDLGRVEDLLEANQILSDKGLLSE